MKYIITGTGRCGTKYMAQLLQSCGVDCAHDVGQIAPDKWHQYDAVSSFRGWAFLDRLEEWGNPEVIHIVRHPLHVIRSLVLRPFAPHNHAWANEELDLPVGNPMARAAEYYLKVNKLLEKADAYRYRIEDRRSILEYLDLYQATLWDDPMCHAHCNHGISFPWTEIGSLAQRAALMAMATSYGYDSIGATGC